MLELGLGGKRAFVAGSGPGLGRSSRRGAWPRPGRLSRAPTSTASGRRRWRARSALREGEPWPSKAI